MVLVFPLTSNFSVGVVNPIPVLPLASITKCDVSVFDESSTTNAFPVPVCVILTNSVVLLPEKIDCVPPDTFRFPVIIAVVPSNRKLASPFITPEVPVAVKT